MDERGVMKMGVLSSMMSEESHPNLRPLFSFRALRSPVCVMPRFVADYAPQAHPCRLKNPVNDRMLWSPPQSKFFMQLLRQCDYVLYCGVDLRQLLPAKGGALKIVEFFVELAAGVVRSVADALAFLERVNRHPPAELPLTPTSPAATAGAYVCCMFSPVLYL